MFGATKTIRVSNRTTDSSPERFEEEAGVLVGCYILPPPHLFVADDDDDENALTGGSYYAAYVHNGFSQYFLCSRPE